MKKWAVGILCGVAFVIGLMATHATWLSMYAEFFHADDAAPGADAIVVLSPIHFERLEKAFQLYEKGFGRELFLTETPGPKPVFTELVVPKLERANLVAEKLGVSPEMTLVHSSKGGATSTWDEAYDLRRYCTKHGLKRIIIVTNAFHTKRAIYAFRRVFEGSGVEVQVAAADNPRVMGPVWWKSDYGLQAYITEFFKFGFYLFHEGNVSFIKNEA